MGAPGLPGMRRYCRRHGRGDAARGAAQRRIVARAGVGRAPRGAGDVARTPGARHRLPAGGVARRHGRRHRGVDRRPPRRHRLALAVRGRRVRARVVARRDDVVRLGDPVPLADRRPRPPPAAGDRGAGRGGRQRAVGVAVRPDRRARPVLDAPGPRTDARAPPAAAGGGDRRPRARGPRRPRRPRADRQPARGHAGDPVRRLQRRARQRRDPVPVRADADRRPHHVLGRRLARGRGRGRA